MTDLLISDDRAALAPPPTPPAPGPARTTGLQRWTLLAVCAATAVLMLDIAVVNTALSSIARDLRTGLSGVQWVIDAYTLAMATVVLTAGALADRFGRRRSFVAGLVLFTVSSAACAAAGSIGALEAARAVQGVGAAILFAVSLALLANVFPDAKERTAALAVYGATIGGSFALGPLAGGALTSGFGWRAVFLVNVPIGIACAVVTVTRLRESRDPHPRRVDVPGQVLLTAGTGSLVLGLLRGNLDGWGSTPILGLLVGAAVLLAAFGRHEARSPEPMLPLGMLRVPAFAAVQLSAFAISATLFAVFLYATLYLQQVLDLSPIQAGLVYVPATMINAVAAGATAQGLGHVRRGTLVAVGLALVALGMAGIAVGLGTHASWWAFEPGMVVAMIGTGIFNPACSELALEVPERQAGLAAGIMDTARQGGIAVGVAALGVLIPAQAGLGAADPTAFVSGLRHALLVGAALAVAAALVAWRAIRPAAD